MKVLKCLLCKVKFAVNHGQCSGCSRKSHTQVKAGKTSWEAMEQAGTAKKPANKRQAQWRFIHG